ncbi:MAG: Tol-Pal system beta propeller repeat protein TolB [Candidatus Zixiibacteriota bacterium]|nr:MAG: Tol-Pal system beta propeller repeat protein TolB [candidate division Zixibacteria bacterium]
MSLRVRLALVIGFFLFYSTASAQMGDEVRNIFFDTISGEYQATPIGVDDMRYIGNRYITHDDSVLMDYATRIVRSDLDFYADFELIPIDSFYLKTYEINELTVLGWRRLGADILVRLEAEFPGDKLRVRWRLFDTVRQQQFSKGVLERTKSQWRVLGHEIANEMVHTLTGEEGIFLTKVVYCREVGGGKELFLADYDGANERQLTSTGSINISPFFSPDRDEIYFTSYMGGDPQLYRINIGNREIKKVAAYSGIVAAPAVSPDGNKIACVLTKDGNSEIYVLDLSGRIIKRLTRHRSIDTAPTWSPDGRMIAFSSDRTGSPQIYLMDSDGLNVRRLTYQGGYNDSPIWSSRGERITFVSRTKYGRFDLASIDTSGHDYRILTEVGHNENPHFSPDGKHIVFSSTRLGPKDIFTMDITGRNQRRLTRVGKCSNPNWGPIRK